MNKVVAWLLQTFKMLVANAVARRDGLPPEYAPTFNKGIDFIKALLELKDHREAEKILDDLLAHPIGHMPKHDEPTGG